MGSSSDVKTRIIAATPVSVGFTVIRNGVILIVRGFAGTRMMYTKPDLRAGELKCNMYCYSMCLYICNMSLIRNKYSKKN